LERLEKINARQAVFQGIQRIVSCMNDVFQAATARILANIIYEEPFMTRLHYSTLLVIASGLGIAALWLSIRELPPAHAMTAHGTEMKTMATVPLDAGMEAIVTLDNVTGELSGYVLDRFTGKFFIEYHHNVGSDFVQRRGVRPRFSMVAGVADFRQFSENERLADGVIYISEDSTGKLMAYGLPWNSQFRASTTGPQQRKFVALDFADTRRIPIRE
jgi:hypothetical protein